MCVLYQASAAATAAGTRAEPVRTARPTSSTTSSQDGELVTHSPQQGAVIISVTVWLL